MSTTNRNREFNAFLELQREVIGAIQSDDTKTVHDAMEEIEILARSTTWPRLREAVGNFFRLHAEHVPTAEARDARTLACVRMELEEADQEPYDAVMSAYGIYARRFNLASAEDILRRTNDPSIRADAAALLRKYGAHAEFNSININV